jgi:anionic cell wall polymer biosynthesis LytR-Cps2A-Psr (LCP) family protein
MKKKKLLLLIVELLGVFAIIAGVIYFQKRAEMQDAGLVSADEAAYRYRPSITYQGKEYPLKRNMSSVLLIGTDNYADDSKQYEGLPYNFNMADFLVVLVFDHSAKTITPFQICRDTMCDVKTTSGVVQRMQITMAHSYGSGKEDSCENTRLAAETLLFGVPIDSFLGFSMDVVPPANDLVGGVTLTLEDDIPGLGKNYVKGATITLHGSEALRFVRYRDTSLLDDNLRRMGHHRLYITAFTEQAKNLAAKDPDFTMRAFRAVEKFLCTDLTVDNISRMLENINEYEVRPAVTPKGAYQEGERFAEYNVDEHSLWECVHSVFCA